MTAWGLVSIASLVATGAVAAYVFLRVPRTVSSLPFGLLMMSFAMWNLGGGLGSLAPAPDPDLMPLIRLEWVGISLTSGAFLHFVLNFSSGRPLRERPRLVPPVYAGSAVVGGRGGRRLGHGRAVARVDREPHGPRGRAPVHVRDRGRRGALGGPPPLPRGPGRDGAHADREALRPPPRPLVPVPLEGAGPRVRGVPRVRRHGPRAVRHRCPPAEDRGAVPARADPDPLGDVRLRGGFLPPAEGARVRAVPKRRAVREGEPLRRRPRRRPRLPRPHERVRGGRAVPPPPEQPRDGTRLHRDRRPGPGRAHGGPARPAPRAVRRGPGVPARGLGLRVRPAPRRGRGPARGGPGCGALPLRVPGGGRPWPPRHDEEPPSPPADP